MKRISSREKIHGMTTRSDTEKTKLLSEGEVDDKYDLFDELSAEAYRDEADRRHFVGWEPNAELSHARVAVYTHGRSAIVACRGSKGCKDWVCNIVLVTGCMSCTKEHKDLVRLVKCMQESELYDDIKLTGHSRGGTMAINVAKQLDLYAYVFNPGSGICELSQALLSRIAQCFVGCTCCGRRCCRCCKDSECLKDSERITIVRSYGDIVSLLGLVALNVESVIPSKTPHTMDNF